MSLCECKEIRNILNAAPVYSNRIKDYSQTGERRFVIRKGQPWPKTLLDGTYPYCVLPTGEVRISENPRPRSNISHSELVAEKDVIGAGMLQLKDGKIIYVSNESGHYSPDVDSINFTLTVFRYWRIPLADNLKSDSRWSHFG